MNRPARPHPMGSDANSTFTPLHASLSAVPKPYEAPSQKSMDVDSDIAPNATLERIFVEGYGAVKHMEDPRPGIPSWSVSRGTMEVETRLGVRSGNYGQYFDTGILEDHFETLLETSSSQSFWRHTIRETVDEIYEGKRRRWTYASPSGTVDDGAKTWIADSTWIQKTMINQANPKTEWTDINVMTYDCRTALSLEKIVAAPFVSSTLAETKATTLRYKRTHLFVPLNKGTQELAAPLDEKYIVDGQCESDTPNAWTFELSRVVTIELAYNQQKTKRLIKAQSCRYEAEFELMAPLRCAGVPAWCYQVLRQLHWLISTVVMPNVRTVSRNVLDDLSAEKIDLNEESNLCAYFWKTLSAKQTSLNPFVEHGRNGKPPPFPGTLPQACSRRHVIDTLASDTDKFMVVEKTDGMRFWMILEQSGRLLIWERSGTIYRLSTAQFEVTHPVWKSMYDAHMFPMVVDGEIVSDIRHSSSAGLAYYVFDALIIGGTIAANESLESRLESVDTFVGFLSSCINSTGNFPRAKLPFKVFAKKYYPLSKVKELRSSIHNELKTGIHEVDDASDWVYVDGINGHIHRNDGLIFVKADIPYYDVSFPQLKWKRTSDQTVDFNYEVYSSSSRSRECEFHIKTANGGMTTILNDIGKINPDDWTRLQRDIRLTQRASSKRGYERDRTNTRVIVEMSYAPNLGYWVYRKLRPEKRMPNSLMTAIDTFERQAEAMHIDELVSHFTSE